jgi:hypothetical protein
LDWTSSNATELPHTLAPLGVVAVFVPFIPGVLGLMHIRAAVLGKILAHRFFTVDLVVTTQLKSTASL